MGKLKFEFGSGIIISQPVTHPGLAGRGMYEKKL